MTIALIRQALDKRLAALDATPIVAQNTGDSAPADGSMYQQTTFIPTESDDAVHGSKMHCKKGIYHIRIKAPMGVGTADADARAVALETQFKRGTTLTQGGVSVLITRTPITHQGYEDGGYWVVPFEVRWQSWVVS